MYLIKNLRHLLNIFLLIMVLITACSPSPPPDPSLETIVKETLTAAAPLAEAESTVEPTVVPTMLDFPAQKECMQLNTLLAAHISLPSEVEHKSFDDAAIGLTGEGCEVSAMGDGNAAANWGANVSAFLEALSANGWQEDLAFSGAGAGGLISVYRKDGTVCQVLIESSPVDLQLCSDDEPFFACMERLPAEQKQYLMNIACTPDRSPTNQTEADNSIAPFPAVIPNEFQNFMQAFFDTGVPVMLPEAFPVEAGLPAIYPNIVMAEPNLYEAVLEYGPDCNRAGACRYGSLGAVYNPSKSPTSTPSFIYDTDQAVPVRLDNNIPAAYIQGLCGANCSDSILFWNYGDYQYMLGLKGASQEMVIDLANAMMLNSIQ